MTPEEKMDPSEILNEKNVDIRRELIRKIGIERFMQVAKTRTLHARGNYELLALDLSPEMKGCKFLKMLNPSIGIWHVEGVPNTCNTVEEALEARLPTQLRQVPIDEVNGADYYQQGDVVIWNREASSRKRLPCLLT